MLNTPLSRLLCCVFTLIFVQTSRAQEKVTPDTYQASDAYKTITQHLADPKNQARLDSLRKLANNPTEKDFSYTKEKAADKSRYRLKWNVQLKTGVTLTDANRTLLQNMLADIVEQDGGLVTARSGGVVDVEIGVAQPEPPAQAQSQPKYVYCLAYSFCRGTWVYVAVKAAPEAQPKKESGPAGSVPQQTVKGASATPPPKNLLADDYFADDYPKEAETCFAKGAQAYQRRDYALARSYLNQAVRLQAQDARYWYLKALTELAMEAEPTGRASVQVALKLHKQEHANVQQVETFLADMPEASRRLLGLR